MIKYKITAWLAGILAIAAPLVAGNRVPYSSDLYPGGRKDAGWLDKNMVSRYGVSWLGEDADSYSLAIEATGAAKKPYDSSQTKTADAWLISPLINLTAGTEYTVTVYARTVAHYGETESFRIKAVPATAIAAADDQSALASAIVAGLKGEESIIDKPNYTNTGAFEKVEAVFTPSVTGEYYFGIQCYSAPDMDTLFLTRFSVTGDSGSGNDPGLDPVAGKAMPYVYDFADSNEFNNEWTKVSGPEAVETATKWSYNNFLHCAIWDYTEDLREDNWLISPALAVEEPGSYAIDLRTMVDGKLEVMLGTDKDDLSSFTVVETLTSNPLWDDDERPLRIPVEIENRGTYYVAFHAAAESGSYMGYRIGYMAFKPVVSTPGVATDMKALPDSFDELSVSVSWVYPSVTNSGEPLESIVKAELYRNDALLTTYYAPVPGQSWAYQDNAIPEPGIYTYELRVYGPNGYDTDHAPARAVTSYVGCPMVEMPVNLSVSADNALLFTIYDNNEDGNGWSFNEGWWSADFKSTNNTEGGEMDDWIATPYVALQPGVYRLTMSTGGANNTYEIGYATNRHLMPTTFVKLLDVDNDKFSSTSNHECFVKIEEAGNYCFVVHHTGALIDPEDKYYNEVTFDGFKLEVQPVLPGVATDLTAEAAADNAHSVVVTWTNPDTDIVGDPVTALVKAEILRNGDVIATITEGLVPGQTASYTDTAMEEDGEYIYSVLVYNENGISEDAAPEVSVFVGEGTKAPYATTTFDDWKSVSTDSWYKWEYNSYWEVFGFSKSWGDPVEAHAFSPYFELENDYTYEVAVTVEGGSSVDAELLHGTQRDTTALVKLGDLGQEAADKEYVFTVIASGHSTQSDEAEEERPSATVAPGKHVFALHVDKNGSINIKSFRLDGKHVGTGVETIVAAAGVLTYQGGVVSCAEAADLTVFGMDGTTLITASGVTSLDLRSLAKGQTVIVVATLNGTRQTLKIKL